MRKEALATNVSDERVSKIDITKYLPNEKVILEAPAIKKKKKFVKVSAEEKEIERMKQEQYEEELKAEELAKTTQQTQE